MRQLLLLCSLLLVACSERPPRSPALDAALESPEPPEPPAQPPGPPDAGSGLDAGSRAASTLVRPAFCDRPRDDAVHEVFCAPEAPAVSDLIALERLLGFDPYQKTGGGDYGLAAVAGSSGYVYDNADSGVALNLNAVLLGLSTGLSGRLVSPINPRAILIGGETFIAYQRGVQQVELAAQDRDGGELGLYLVRFEQACNALGCSATDLFSARVEHSWTRVTLQDAEELKNTPLDCRQCHQRNRMAPTLLMRELEGPWNHFFAHDRDDQAQTPYPEPMGRDLVRDYRRAKGDEAYAGLPIAILRGTVGLALQGRVDAYQPLLFAGNTILNETWPWIDGDFVSAPQRSASWDANYQAFRRGEVLPLPHYRSRPTDADKQARLSEQYARYQRGELAELPDLADIFPDDPTLRAELGLQTAPDDPPATLLITACGSCHNDVLDQGISRALFNIDLSRMSEAERLLAVERMSRPAGALGVMPPAEARQLTSEARDALVLYLQGETRSAEEDALLRRAAALGMAVEPDYARPAL